MGSDPTGRVECARVAFPITTETATPRHSGVELEVKSTFPPSGTGDTVAVNVTDSPNTDGFSDEATVVVVEVTAGPAPAFASTVISFPAGDPPLLPLTDTRASRPLPSRSTAASASGPKPTA